MRKIKFVILLTFVGFLFITSCKKDKSTNSETEEPIPLVLDSNTVVLNLNNVSSIIEAHENYMIVSNLSIGNGRIASGHGSIELKQNSHFACEPNDKYPKGAFKKVESIEPYGQGTNYTQINFYAYSLNDPIPQITEAVISGSAKDTKAVTNEISSVYDNLGNLIPFSFDGGKLKIELTKTIDLDDDLRTKDDQFKITGTLKTNLDLDYDFRFKNREIEKIKLISKITPELDVKVSKSMKKPLYQVKKKINLYNIYLNPIVVPMGVPPIVFPVVFNPVIAINAEVSATGDIKIEGTVLEYKSSFGAGFEYSKSNGFKYYKSEPNLPPITLNPSLVIDFEGQLKTKLEPEMSFRLYDQPDISISTGLGFYAKLKLTASAGVPPPNFDLNLEGYMGIEGNLAANLKLFKKSIIDWSAPYTVAEVKVLDVKKFVTNWNANQIDLSNGLLAYYPFNGNANDESGNGNNGTINGATLTSDRHGNVNRAYSFDGLDSIVCLSNNNKITSKYAISLWIKPTEIDTTLVSPVAKSYGLIKKWSNLGPDKSEYNISIYGNTSGKKLRWLQYSRDDNNTYEIDFNSTRLRINLNTWGNIIINVSSNNIVTCYINGQYIYEYYLVNNFYFDNTNLPLIIGKEFKGAIDDVRIYNRTLTNDEIQRLYTE